jgi:drug/metabolite transporter (DMT)-like permease
VLVLGQLLGAVALLLCFWLLTEPPSWPPLAVWPALLVTALLATAVAYFVQTFVQQRLPAAETALLILLEAPLAAAFGILLRGERLSPLQWLGGGLMLAAVAWSAMRTTGDG